MSDFMLPVGVNFEVNNYESIPSPGEGPQQVLARQDNLLASKTLKQPDPVSSFEIDESLGGVSHIQEEGGVPTGNRY